MPITQNQFGISRGQVVREQIAVVRNICSDDLNGCKLSIQPLFTKCKVGSAEENDIDDIKSNVSSQLNMQLENEKRSYGQEQ